MYLYLYLVVRPWSLEMQQQQLAMPRGRILLQLLRRQAV
jgi:hypothetical protein